MNTFDAPNRSFCVVRRQKTITPLQALVLMNDPQFVEMCRAMSDRIRVEGGDEVKSQIGYGFRLVTGRKPLNKELDVLLKLYREEIDKYQRNPELIAALHEVGSYKSNQKLDPVSGAAMVMVCNIMMSHDEAFIIR
jgi:hypothetical protein